MGAGLRIPGVRAIAEEGPWVSATPIQDPWLYPSLGALKAEPASLSSEERLALASDLSQVALLSPSAAPVQQVLNPAPQEQAKTYVVKKGDALSRIASAFRVTVTDLMNANPILKKTRNVKIGQVLVIPNAATNPGPQA